jgi:O-antigen/teichoic acid export membrane protein
VSENAEILDIDGSTGQKLPVLEYAPAGPARPAAARVARNFLTLSLGNVIVRVCNLVAGMYARRAMGSVAIGQASWATSVLSYFYLIVNPGLETIAKREVAKNPSESSRLVSLLFSLQLVLALSSMGVVLLVAALGLRGPAISLLLIFQAVGFVVLPINVTWLLHSHERMTFPTLMEIILQALMLPALFLFVHRPEDVYLYALLPHPFRLIYAIAVVWYASRLRLFDWRSLRFTLRGARELIKECLPLGLSQASIALYCNADAIFLGFTHGDAVVGFYSTAYNLMFVGTFVSTSLMTAAFPALTRAAADPDRARRISTEFLRLLVWAGCGLALLGFGAGRYVTVLFYGQKFAESGPIFEWLCLDLALIFFNIGISQPFNAWGHQREILKITAFGAVVNLGLNILIIPKYGAYGAVATTLISETFVLVACLHFRRRIFPINWFGAILQPLAITLAIGVTLKWAVIAAPALWILWAAAAAGALALAFFGFERKTLREIRQ